MHLFCFVNPTHDKWLNIPNISSKFGKIKEDKSNSKLCALKYF